MSITLFIFLFIAAYLLGVLIILLIFRYLNSNTPEIKWDKEPPYNWKPALYSIFLIPMTIISFFVSLVKEIYDHFKIGCKLRKFFKKIDYKMQNFITPEP